MTKTGGVAGLIKLAARIHRDDSNASSVKTVDIIKNKIENA
ncbi:hypothetical protein P4S70_25745 [Enterovibrio sp. Hal110]